MLNHNLGNENVSASVRTEMVRWPETQAFAAERPFSEAVCLVGHGELISQFRGVNLPEDLSVDHGVEMWMHSLQGLGVGMGSKSSMPSGRAERVEGAI